MCPMIVSTGGHIKSAASRACGASMGEHRGACSDGRARDISGNGDECRRIRAGGGGLTRGRVQVDLNTGVVAGAREIARAFEPQLARTPVAPV